MRRILQLTMSKKSKITIILTILLTTAFLSILLTQKKDIEKPALKAKIISPANTQQLLKIVHPLTEQINSCIKGNLFKNSLLAPFKNRPEELHWKNFHLKTKAGEIYIARLENTESGRSKLKIFKEDKDGFPRPIDSKKSTLANFLKLGKIFYSDKVFSLSKNNLKITIFQNSKDGIEKFNIQNANNFIECTNLKCHCSTTYFQ